MTVDATGAVSLLYRRLGFGATAGELSAAVRAGYSTTAKTLVAGLTQPDPAGDAIAPPAFTPIPANPVQLRTDLAARKAYLQALRSEARQLMAWWIARMLATSTPAKEKLTFLLHGHFPTAVSKVRYAQFMYQQNQLFRTAGPGNFTQLTQGIAVDPAMLIWLDAASDKAASPNENFARELMERFTMGIGTYTESDVRAAAYCFTGWRLNLRTGAFSIAALDHSSAPQTFLGHVGINSGTQVVEIATTTPASSRFVPAALWSHMAYPISPNDPVAHDLATGYGADHDIANLLAAIVGHPKFVSGSSMHGLIKQPVEYVVGALRALSVGASALQARADGVLGVLAALGQIPFNPPSVGGWGQNSYWLSTAAALTRWQFATALTRVADISPVADAAPRARVEAAAQLLSVPTWTSSTAKSLAAAKSNPAELVSLALVSPEYVGN